MLPSCIISAWVLEAFLPRIDPSTEGANSLTSSLAFPPGSACVSPAISSAGWFLLWLSSPSLSRFSEFFFATDVASSLLLSSVVLVTLPWAILVLTLLLVLLPGVW
jgi:hypothetical protein